MRKVAGKVDVADGDVADNPISYTGSCVCGLIRYQAKAVRPLWFCHCRQCRNITGNFMAAAQVGLSDIDITGEPKWYYVSDKSRHGFCSECGSQMFWRNDDNAFLSITGGSLDDARGLAVKGHIFTDEKGEYYTIPDTEPQFSLWWDEEDEQVIHD